MTPAPAHAVNFFQAQPGRFMHSNSIRWQGQSPGEGGIRTVGMLIEEDAYARYRTGSRFLGFGNAKANASVYVLKMADNTMNPLPTGTPTFDVYWSGYLAGSGVNFDLPVGESNTGEIPDIMLTPEFTGCAAVCCTHEDGSARFSHYNYVHSIGERRQVVPRTGMAAHADLVYTEGEYAMLTKEDYRGMAKHRGNVNMTVVGFRSEGSWEFWAQLREDKTSGSQIRVVRKL